MFDIPKLTTYIKKDPSAYKTNFFDIYNELHHSLSSDSFWAILSSNKTSSNATKHFTTQFNFINATMKHYLREEGSPIIPMADLLLNRLSTFSSTTDPTHTFSFHTVPQNLANSILQFILIVVNTGNLTSEYLLKISSSLSSFPKKQRKRLMSYLSISIYSLTNEEQINFLEKLNEKLLKESNKINSIKLLLNILVEGDNKQRNILSITTINSCIVPFLIKRVQKEEDPEVLSLILKFFLDKKVNSTLSDQNLFNNSAKYFDFDSNSKLINDCFGKYIENKKETIEALIKRFKSSKLSFFIKLSMLHLILKLNKQSNTDLESNFFKYCFSNYLNKYIMYPETFGAVCSVISVCFSEHIQTKNYRFIFEDLIKNCIYKKNINESHLYVLKMFKIALRNSEELKEVNALKSEIISFKETLIKENRKKKTKKNIVSDIVKLRNNIIREINTILNVYKEENVIDENESENE